MTRLSNPSYLGGRGQADHNFESIPGKKFTRPSRNQWLGMVIGTCHPRDGGKAQIWLWYKLTWVQSETLSKTTNTESWQYIVCLLSMRPWVQSLVPHTYIKKEESRLWKRRILRDIHRSEEMKKWQLHCSMSSSSESWSRKNVSEKTGKISIMFVA
jgi:hypothetical protein